MSDLRRDDSESWFDSVENRAPPPAVSKSSSDDWFAHVEGGVGQLAQVEAECKNNGQPYTDPSFPPSEHSLGTFDTSDSFDGDLRRAIVWVRTTELGYSKVGAPIFPIDAAASDIVQGEFPDCFFIAAVSSLARHVERIKNLFLSKTVSAHGVYAFQFFQQGRWMSVLIDDYIPCFSKGSNKKYIPLFATCRRGNMWPALLEKAYAKLYGSFAAIKGGNISEALMDLTGCPVEDFSLAKVPSQQLSLQLVQSFERGCALTAGTPNDAQGRMHVTNARGLVHGHAYTLLRAVHTDTGLWIQLHNPTDKDTVNWPKGIDPTTKQKLESLREREGEFWMSLADFQKQFQSLNVCKLLAEMATDVILEDEFSPSTAGGCNNFTTWRKNPWYAISSPLEDNMVVYITMSNPNQRGIMADINYHQIGFTVVKYAGSSINPASLSHDHQVAAKTTFWNKREVSLEVSFLAQPMCLLLQRVSHFHADAGYIPYWWFLHLQTVPTNRMFPFTVRIFSHLPVIHQLCITLLPKTSFPVPPCLTRISRCFVRSCCDV